RQGRLVLGRFNNLLVRSDPVHFVEQPFAFAIELAFNPQRWKAIRDHTDVPAGGIGASPVAAVGQNLRRCLSFIARTERAVSWRARENAFAQKIHWPLPAVR